MLPTLKLAVVVCGLCGGALLLGQRVAVVVHLVEVCCLCVFGHGGFVVTVREAVGFFTLTGQGF